MKTLIIEDDFASLKLLEAYLGPYGPVTTSETGEKGLEEFLSALNSNQPFDLICLDIMLPGMDGQEILEKIREAEEEKSILGLAGVKIVMTTALGDSQNIMKAFSHQCEHYLTKPISMTSVKRVLEELELIASS